MAIRMARPYKHAKTGIWWLRARVPKDVAEKARGLKVPVPVGSERREIVLGDDAKISLSTRDPAVAKTRFTAAMDALAAIYEGIRSGPITLNFMQREVISGSVYLRLIADTEDEPGQPERWREHAALLRDHSAEDDEGAVIVQELLAGELIDNALAERGWRITADSRHAVRREVMSTLAEFVGHAEAMANADYSKRRFPVSLPPKKRSLKGAAKSVSFNAIIDERIRRKASGKDAKPTNPATIAKFRRESRIFSEWRKSNDATTVTRADLDGFVNHLQTTTKLSNRTIGHYIVDLGTVTNWGRGQSPEAFPERSPFERFERPDFTTIAASERAFRLDEARKILLEARQSSDPAIRWLPFMAAYSGARISEISYLTREDFRELDERWYYRIFDNPFRPVKTKSSRRTVPVHPALVAEGLIDFVLQTTSGMLFKPNDHETVGRWMAKIVKLDREGLQPSHGWRHLMTDMLTVTGASNRVRLGLLGRASGTSEDGYGGSDAALPGLWMELAKVEPIIPIP